jgi:hypothetical protein
MSGISIGLIFPQARAVFCFETFLGYTDQNCSKPSHSPGKGVGGVLLLGLVPDGKPSWPNSWAAVESISS